MADLSPNMMHDLASGGSVTIRLSSDIRKVQLVSEGFDLEDCTAVVTPIGTQGTKALTIADGIGVTCTFGDDDFRMTSVTISGVTGSGLKVGAYQ